MPWKIALRQGSQSTTMPSPTYCRRGGPIVTGPSRKPRSARSRTAGRLRPSRLHANCVPEWHHGQARGARPAVTRRTSPLPSSSRPASTPLAACTVVQAAHDRQLDDFAALRRLHRTRLRRVLAKRQVRAARVVVLRHVPAQQPPKVSLVHHDRMVHEFPPHGPDHALHARRLPRGAWRAFPRECPNDLVRRPHG